MNLKSLFQPASYPPFPSAALLILRLIAGSAFILHGWGKIQKPFSWMPAEAPMQIPGFFQFLAALAEFGGGIALVLGALVPVAALGLIFTMGVAVHFHMIVLKDPFVNDTGGGAYESALVYLGVALAFLALGPGRYSVDAVIFGRKP